MVKNGNFTFLQLELILADQLADLIPQGQSSSGQEWQYEISTVRAHIGRSNGISTSQQECQFQILLLELILADLPLLVATASDEEWQYEISTVRPYIGRSTGIISSGQQ